MTDKFDGDTLIIIGANGADYDVVGGDPARDPGFINHINIATLTEPGWCGNELEPVELVGRPIETLGNNRD